MIPGLKARIVASQLDFNNRQSNEIFNENGYKSYGIHGNIGHLTLVYIPCIALIWICAWLKDFLVRRYDVVTKVKPITTTHEPWMHNFANRFLYEIYFELLLCVLISLSNPKGGESFFTYCILGIFIALNLFVIK